MHPQNEQGSDEVCGVGRRRGEIRLMTGESNEGSASAAAQLRGTLVVTPERCLAIRRGDEHGEIAAVVWPYGWTAEKDEAGLAVLRNATGTVVATEGQRMGIAGAFTSNPPDHECARERTFYAGGEIDLGQR